MFLGFTKPIFSESSVKINSYSATSPEFVELINNSNSEVNLNGWSIRNNNSSTIDDIFLTSVDIISANFSTIFNNTLSPDWLDDSADTIYLYNASNILVDTLTYSTPSLIPTIVPTLVPTATPSLIPTIVPTLVPTATSTPTPNPTPTPTVKPTATPLVVKTPTPTTTNNKNLYKLDESATASAVFTPIEESDAYITPVITPNPISSNLILDDTPTIKKRYLPLIFIVSGGSLLVTPLLIDKFKKK